MRRQISILLTLTLLATCTVAICSGWTYAIADTGQGTWNVYNTSCEVVKAVSAANPCTVGVFGCSPAPIKFTTLNLNQTTYACVSDTTSETCDVRTLIQFCCSRLVSPAVQAVNGSPRYSPSSMFLCSWAVWSIIYFGSYLGI